MMILNVDASTRPYTTAPPHTGCVAVPDSDDFVVLLILDFGAGTGNDPPAEGLNPWWHMRSAGYPCLLAVPVLPIKTSPLRSRCPPSEKSNEIEERSEAKTKTNNGAGDGANENVDASFSSSYTSNTANTSEDIFYVRLRNAATSLVDGIASTAEVTLTRERWFQVWLPCRSAAEDLRVLLHASEHRETSRETKGKREGEKEDGLQNNNSACVFHAVCRDMWPLPPVSPSAPPSPSAEELRLPFPPHMQWDDAPLHISSPHSPHDNGEGKAEREPSVRENVDPIWAALSSHLRRLRNWNKSLMAYLFDSANHVGEAWLATGTVAAAAPTTTDVRAAAALPQARPSALRLLRLIFQFWQRLLQEPSAMCLTAHPGTSPLRCTPTQISRAFFHDKQHQQKQKVGAEDVELPNEGATPSSPRSTAPHEEQPGSSTFSASLPLTTALPGDGVTGLPSLQTANGCRESVLTATTAVAAPYLIYHLTPVTIVEKLLLSIDFSLDFHESLATQRQPLLHAGEDGDEDNVASAHTSTEPPQCNAPILSPIVSFAEVWGSYLVRRMLRAAAAANPLSEAFTSSCSSNNTHSSDMRTAEPMYDLGCTALDVWSEWVQVTQAASSLGNEPIITNHSDNEDLKMRSAATTIEITGAVPVLAEAETHDADAPAARYRHGQPLIEIPAVTSQISSPSSSSSQPRWRPQSPPQQSLRLPPKGSTSRVSFSVSDVQRPYNAGVAPELVAAEAAERAAARHRKERISTPPTQPVCSDVRESSFIKEKFCTSSTSPVNMRRTARKTATASQTASISTSTAVADAAAELLKIIPSFQIHESKAKSTVATTTLTTQVKVTAAPSTPPTTFLITIHDVDVDTTICEHSELPSVLRTALPLRPTSSEDGRGKGSCNSAMRHEADTPNGEAGQPTPPPSRIESWASSASTSTEKLGDDAHEHTREVVEVAGEEVDSNDMAAQSTPPHVYNTTTVTTTTNFSSSSSTIASENRLFPFIDDDDHDESNSPQNNSEATPSTCHAPPFIPHAVTSPITKSSEAANESATAKGPQMISPPSPSKVQKRRGGMYSAASFTTVLMELLTQVLAYNVVVSHPSFCSSPLTKAVPVNDVVHAQRRLESIHRGQLFPSLVTLDTLNLLPYYVHVWCFTFDPLTQKKKLLGGASDGSDSGGGGGNLYAQTYLKRYESGSGSSYCAGSGGGGDTGREFGGSAGLVSSQQLLRNLMMEGARTLWYSVKSTAQRRLRDAMAITSDASANANSNDGGMVQESRSRLSQAFTRNTLINTPSAPRATTTAVYGNSSSGSRDLIKDPTLYNAVCGLYITEQDIIIRSMPTEEVRKRRERLRQRQRMQRQQQQQRNVSQTTLSLQPSGSSEKGLCAPQLHRPRSAMDIHDSRVVHPHRKSMRHDGSIATAAKGEGDVGREDDEVEEDDYEDLEQAELLLLPRVGLLSVTACSVSRNSGGVFAEKYAHKLFLHQEDQVVALRAQQQQQQRYRHNLRSAASSVGLAEVAPSPFPALSPSQYSSVHQPNSSDSGGAPTRSLTSPIAPIRTHTTLQPFIEDVLQRQQAHATAHAMASSPHHNADGSQTNNKSNSSSSASTLFTRSALHTDRHRRDVQRCLTSLFRSNQTGSTQGADDRHTHSGDGVFVHLFSRANIEAAAATASASATSANGSICSATATAFAAAASSMSATTAPSSQPTVVLKLVSKSMPTVWLEFADEATLLYVYHLIEAPLRSSPPSSTPFKSTTPVELAGTGSTSAPAASFDKTSTSSPLSRNLSVTAISTSSSPPATATPAASTNTASYSASSLSCFGNRFLSSARRHSSMVPLVMVAAKVLPHGSAPSPFLLTFLKNVSAVMTLLKLAPTANITMPIHDYPVEGDGKERSVVEGKTRPSVQEGRPAPLQRESKAAGPPPPVAAAALSLADTWWLYDPAREFTRQGFAADRWTLTDVNSSFQFCPTYPSRFVVPTAVAEAMELGELNGQHRLSKRVEAVSFLYAPTGGVLVRSAQPAVARLFVNSATPALEVASMVTGGRFNGGDHSNKNIRNGAPTHNDGSNTSISPSSPQPQPAAPPPSAAPSTIPLMDAPFLILNAFAAAAGFTAQQLFVMDLRAVTAAYANTMRGGGTMEMLLYPFGGVEYAGLPNVHVIRQAWQRLRQSLIDVPYRLNADGAPRRETQFVLRGGEPPYAAVVAAAERSSVTARSLPSLAPPPLPSSRSLPQDSKTATSPPSLHDHLSKEKGDDEDDLQRRERCLGVVQQAPIAARSGSDRQRYSLSTAFSRKVEDEGNIAGEAAGATQFAAKSKSSGGEGCSTAETTSSMLTSNSNAAAAEIVSSPQQEWLGFLAGLLNTSVVAARRVCGVPTDPLYVPAMEHNGAMANCFSYIVGHAFTRFWLPVSSHNAGTQRCRSSERGPLSSRQPWWSSRSDFRGAPSPSHFDATIASFGPSAHRTLAQVVFLNCSDGWDRTAQVSVLTQLLLDPYYRTVEGLCILLERELLCFGHPLRTRSTSVRGNMNGGWEAETKSNEVHPATASAVDDDHPVEKGESRGVDTHINPDKESASPSAGCGEVRSTAVQDASSTTSAPTPTTTSLLNPVSVNLPETDRSNTNNDCCEATANAEEQLANDDDFESWLNDIEEETSFLSETAGTGTAAEKTTSEGDRKEVDASSTAAQEQQQLWSRFWRRVAVAVSDRASVLKHKVENRATSAGVNLGNSDNGGGRRVPAASSSPCSSISSSSPAVPSFSAVPREASPILPQLLDAIYQLVRLYPACFEFTEQFLLWLTGLFHCGLVGTFAVNSEAQAAQEGVARGTLSLSQWCALLLATTTISRQYLVTPAITPSLSSVDAQGCVNEDPAAWEPNSGGGVSGVSSRQRQQIVRNSVDDGSATPPPVRVTEAFTNACTRPQQPQLPFARAIYTFDCSTSWLQDNAEATATQGTRSRASPSQLFSSAPFFSSSSGEGGEVERCVDFCRRLLPISLDALYTSGYLNPEFSLKYNRHNVGPLVDFILPSQLIVWRAIYAQFSFWSHRATQLQHGVGPVDLYGVKSEADSSARSTVWAEGNKGVCRAELGGHHRPPPSTPIKHSEGTAADTLADGGICGSTIFTHREALNRAVHSDFITGRKIASDRRAGLSATPPSYVSPPGMMNFHIGSDSEDDEEDVIREQRQL